MNRYDWHFIAAAVLTLALAVFLLFQDTPVAWIGAVAYFIGLMKGRASERMWAKQGKS